MKGSHHKKGSAEGITSQLHRKIQKGHGGDQNDDCNACNLDIKKFLSQKPGVNDGRQTHDKGEKANTANLIHSVIQVGNRKNFTVYIVNQIEKNMVVYIRVLGDSGFQINQHKIA